MHDVAVSPSVKVGDGAVNDVSFAVPEPMKKQEAVFKIAPITTVNDWVVVIPFVIEAGILLPNTADYRNIGIVVGCSSSVPRGEVLGPSALKHGDVVLFQKKSVVGEMAINQDPYLGKRLIILSERNIFCKLPKVKYEILDYEIGSEAFDHQQSS